MSVHREPLWRDRGILEAYEPDEGAGDPFGDDLPDLAVRGRGDYRIRVHYTWLPWKGDRYAGQRLLIMAYPGRGDDVVVHRARTKP